MNHDRDALARQLIQVDHGIACAQEALNIMHRERQAIAARIALHDQLDELERQLDHVPR